MENPAVVSAAVNVAYLIINNSVNEESDSALVTRIGKLSSKNALIGTEHSDKVVADSPMLDCLIQSAGDGENSVPPGYAYVFYERRSMGKSSSIRYFCSRNCKSAKVRSLVFAASSGGATYFQRVAFQLDVEFSSNWAACLVAAMKKHPKEDNFSPFLFLDEFNHGTQQDLEDLNNFMRQCQEKGFYLIIVTSEKDIADKIMRLNAWGKMRPLQFLHNGSILNYDGMPGYDPNKRAKWKQVNWTVEQLKNLVIERCGEFDDYSFIRAGMTPNDALFEAEKKKKTGRVPPSLLTKGSDMSV